MISLSKWISTVCGSLNGLKHEADCPLFLCLKVLGNISNIQRSKENNITPVYLLHRFFEVLAFCHCFRLNNKSKNIVDTVEVPFVPLSHPFCLPRAYHSLKVTVCIFLLCGFIFSLHLYQ